MRNAYKELKDRDYNLYQKAIIFAEGLIENINSGAYATNQDSCIEAEIVKFTMAHLSTDSTQHR